MKVAVTGGDGLLGSNVARTRNAPRRDFSAVGMLCTFAEGTMMPPPMRDLVDSSAGRVIR